MAREKPERKCLIPHHHPAPILGRVHVGTVDAFVNADVKMRQIPKELDGFAVVCN